METILIQAFLMLLNLSIGYLNYHGKKYKTSIFPFFTSGFCFTFIVIEIIKLTNK